MARESVTIMISGEAGQGLVTIGELLVKSLVRSGYHIVVTQDYMSRIRGGNNSFVIRAGVNRLNGPVNQVDVIAALDSDALSIHKSNLAPGGIALVDEAFGLTSGDYLQIPYKDLSDKRSFNIVVFGVAGTLIGLEKSILLQALEKAFGKKHPEAIAQTAEVLKKTLSWYNGGGSDKFKLNPPANKVKRLALTGNQAVALGAMAAGVKFCSFYPMTPSTSIALTLAGQAEKMELVVEQAEDEIAAINMAIGASFAGAPAMVTTSGGGYALMCEGISLAAMTETPVVVALVQRPGPATGLPTRTEQGDLEFVLHGGHGEFPRAIFAPGTVEDCFFLTRKAFEIAERFQGPSFILSDQFLADSFRAVEPFDLENGPSVNPLAVHNDLLPAIKKPYERYALTDDGVSPRLLPCISEHLVVADSDEHTPDGHITEDLNVRIKMNDKRLSKQDGMIQEFIPPRLIGRENPDVLFVCWGSTVGPLAEASETLQSRGVKTAVLYFPQVWPLNPETFMDILEDAGHVIGVEGNASGQFSNILRKECGFNITELVLRYDGLPFTPDYILENLEL